MGLLNDYLMLPVPRALLLRNTVSGDYPADVQDPYLYAAVGIILLGVLEEGAKRSW